MADQIKVNMKMSRDTKGTFVYKDDTDNTPVPSIYIRKSAFKGEAPKQITLTIEEKK